MFEAVTATSARARLAAIVGGFVLLAAACVPLTNAPPGGGTVVSGTYQVGPFTVGPGQDVNQFLANIPRPAGAFGLKTSDFELVDANGNPVGESSVHLHHIVVTSSGAKDALCPSRDSRITGTGMERTKLNLPDPYALMVGARDRWGAILELTSTAPAGSAPVTVYVRYKLGYQPGATSSNTRGVTPYFMDVTGCGTSSFDVPGNGGPGSIYTKSLTWTAPADGIAVFSGGHLHNGGIDITLRNETADLEACRGTARYDDMGMITAIPPCTLHAQVTAGNRYSVTARYDNSKPLSGVMGIMLTFVWQGTQ